MLRFSTRLCRAINHDLGLHACVKSVEYLNGDDRQIELMVTERVAGRVYSIVIRRQPADILSFRPCAGRVSPPCDTEPPEAA